METRPESPAQSSANQGKTASTVEVKASVPSDDTLITEEQQNRLQTRLEERGASQPCPRCGTQEFFMLNRGINALQVYDFDARSIKQNVPAVITVCSKCGFVALHALGALGFMKNGEVKIE